MALKSGRSRWKSLLAGTGHDGQGPIHGALGAAADGSIDDDGVSAAGPGHPRAESLTKAGETLLMTTTAVPAAGGSCAQAARSPRGGLDIGQIREHEDNDRLVPEIRHAATREPPRDSKASNAAGERFQALTVQPAARRFAAIGAPIRPEPDKAGFLPVRCMLPHFVVVSAFPKSVQYPSLHSV